MWTTVSWPLEFFHFRHTFHIVAVLSAAESPCSSISGDLWPAHIALDGTQYVRSRKAITIRFRENCPIPHDTTGEYRKIYISRDIGMEWVSQYPAHCRMLLMLLRFKILLPTTSCRYLTFLYSYWTPAPLCTLVYVYFLGLRSFCI